MTGRRILAALILLMIPAAVSFVTGGPRRAVDWRDLRAVVIHSDDWGFAGFAPDAVAWDGVDRDALAPGRFPETYWGSTLEDAAAVTDLAQVLAGVHGRDALPAIFQPNYILFSLEPGFAANGDPVWHRRRLPDLPAAYGRPHLWPAVTAAMARGVWHPELHGAWHYDPELRRQRALEGPSAIRATERGITLFRDAQGARELGPWRSRDDLSAELDTCLEVFTELFGRPPASVIAPDYTWTDRNETLWIRRGIRFIQAKREQRNPDLPGGRAGRLLKWLDRRVAHVVRPDRTYVERNCRFEPAQHPDPGAVTRRCVGEVRRAWDAGEPAVIETHRVNFAHLDSSVAHRGRAELAVLLADLAGRSPGPLFMSDAEVGQLDRRGVSAVVRGGEVVLRNGSHARRIVVVPAQRLERLAMSAGFRSEVPLVVAVPAGMTLRVIPHHLGWRMVSHISDS